MLKVSGSQSGVIVPDIYNKTLAEAVASLEGEGFQRKRKRAIPILCQRAML